MNEVRVTARRKLIPEWHNDRDAPVVLREAADYIAALEAWVNRYVCGGHETTVRADGRCFACAAEDYEQRCEDLTVELKALRKQKGKADA